MAQSERMTEERLRDYAREFRRYHRRMDDAGNVAKCGNDILTELIAERARYDEQESLWAEAHGRAVLLDEVSHSEKARAERAESELQQAKARIGKLEKLRQPLLDLARFGANDPAELWEESRQSAEIALAALEETTDE